MIQHTMNEPKVQRSISDLIRESDEFVTTASHRMDRIAAAKKRCITVIKAREQLASVAGHPNQQMGVDAIEIVFRTSRIKLDLLELVNAYEISRLLLSRIDEALQKAKEELEDLLDQP